MSDNISDITIATAGNISLPQVENEIASYFDQISQIKEQEIISRPNCKFCTHPERFKAEKIWEQYNTYAQVVRFFDDYSKDHPEITSLNTMNVKAHLMNHYNQQMKNIWMREYTDRLKGLINYRISCNKKLEIMGTMLFEQLHEIAANPELCPIKKSDVLTKLSKSLTDIMTAQATLKGDLQPVQIIQQRFFTIWTHLISTQHDPSIKHALMDALCSFEESFKAVDIPSLNQVTNEQQS